MGTQDWCLRGTNAGRTDTVSVTSRAGQCEQPRTRRANNRDMTTTAGAVEAWTVPCMRQEDEDMGCAPWPRGRS